jgi:hypothetical protein
MQPRPRDERLVVDPRPGSNKKIRIPKPNPGLGNGKGKMKPLPVKPIKALPVKPIKGRGERAYPMPRVQPVDDRIVDTMPITRKQLNGIKKMYGI